MAAETLRGTLQRNAANAGHFKTYQMLKIAHISLHPLLSLPPVKCISLSPFPLHSSSRPPIISPAPCQMINLIFLVHFILNAGGYGPIAA